MSGETIITVVGNLTSDPEINFTPSGQAVANFTIASTPRTFDKQSNEWKDGDTLFLRSSVWRDPAQNVADSLQKGMRVVAQGRLKSRSYETKEGEKRTVIEFEIDEIGPSLRYATAKVTRTQSNGGGGQQGQQGGQQNQWNGGGAQQGGQQGGNWGGGQQGQQQGGGFGGGQQGGGWNQGTAAQQQVAAQAQGQGQYGAQQGQGQPQGGQAQQYAQAGANGPQQGAQQGGGGFGGGWGNGADAEPPF